MSETNRQMVQRLRNQLHDSAGYDGDAIAQDRTRALNSYHQRPRGDEVRGRSGVRAGDVSAMVEANLSQMLEAFTNDNVAEFDATGPLDDDQANLESFAVNNAVMKSNNGYQEIGAAIKDALLLRNGWVKMWVDESAEVETLDLANATVDTIAAIREIPGITSAEVLEFDAEARTARVRVTAPTREFRCESVDCVNINYPKQWKKTDVQRIPFIAERHVEMRGELVERGFDRAKVDRLPALGQDTKSDSLARDIGSTPPVGSRGGDKATDLVLWFEIYSLEAASDGTLERRRIALTMGGPDEAILENEPVAIVPYATGSPFINAHRLTGISIWDKLKQTEDITTSLERGLLDNVNSVIKNRTAYLDGKVNTDDLADGRPNGNIRVRSSVGDIRKAMTTFPVQDISQGILANLQHQGQRRAEMAGAALELSTGQMQMGGARIGSQGVDRAFSVMEQIAAHMTKNMATSLMRNMFLIAHATMRANFDQPLPVKVGGRWTSPIPSQWKPRQSVTIKPGMSPGERQRKTQTLGEVINAQLQLADKGMDQILVNIEGFYRALTDWGRSAELPNPEQYFIDPATDESKQALKEKQDAEAQASKANRTLMQQAVGLEQMGRALEKYRADQDTQFKYWRESLLAEIEEAKIVGKVTGDLVSQTKFVNGGNNGNGDAEKISTPE